MYFQTFTGTACTETIHFLQPLFSLMANYISSHNQGKRVDCVKEPQIKRRDEGGKGETHQESQETEERGRQAGRVFKLTIGQGSDGHLI